MKTAWSQVLTEYKKRYPKETGMNKALFPGLLKQLMDRCNPGQYLPKAFEHTGLYPINPKKGMERIPSRHMEEDEETVRGMLNAAFGDKLEELRGVGPVEKKKRGKKVATAPGLSFTEQLEEEDSEEELLMPKAQKKRKQVVETDEEETDAESWKPSESDSDLDLDDVDDLLDARGSDVDLDAPVSTVEYDVGSVKDWLVNGGEGSSRPKMSGDTVVSYTRENDSSSKKMDRSSSKKDDSSSKKDDSSSKKTDGRSSSGAAEDFQVGSFVAAVYDGTWYIAQVEGEEPEEETEGYSLLKYMNKVGNNQFVWGSDDTLKTINSDIMMKVDPPIPISSRLWGLPKEVVKEIEVLMSSKEKGKGKGKGKGKAK
jgi:hypothetical protein